MITAATMDGGDPFDPFALHDDNTDDHDPFAIGQPSQPQQPKLSAEEMYNEVETRKMVPLGLTGSSEHDIEESSLEDHDDDDDASPQFAGDADVFGMSLTDVDLWDDDDDEEDEDLFASSDKKKKKKKKTPYPKELRQQQRPADFGEFDDYETEDRHVPLKGGSSVPASPRKGSSGRKSRSHRSSSREDHHRSRSRDERQHHHRRKPHRTRSNDDVALMAPELASTLTVSSRSPEKERRRHVGRSKSSDFAEDFGSGDSYDEDDRIGELMNLIRQETNNEISSRRERKSGSERREQRSSDGSKSSSKSLLRQRLMMDSSSPSSSKRRTASSVTGGSPHKSRGSSSSSNRHGRRSGNSSESAFHQSFDGFIDEDGDRSSSRRHRSGRSSRGHRGGEDDGGLDSFMKSHKSSSRRDGEHRSVVSAPVVSTPKEALSKRCQKMKMTF